MAHAKFKFVNTHRTIGDEEKMGFPLCFRKVLKCGLVALACLMLASAISGWDAVVPTKATTLPWPPIKIWVTKTANPYYGCFGGYHDVWRAMKPMLAEIGIDLDNRYVSDPWTWWGRVWDVGWSKTHTGGGWDLTMLEWWMMPTGLIPLESLVYSWLTPPYGCNIFPWLDETADKRLWKGMHTLDATERIDHLWWWQEMFMHNPPMVNMYYPRLCEVTADWVEGWDAVVRFRDISHLAINQTLFAEHAPEWRKAEPNTLIYAVGDDVWSLIPLFMHTLTEEWMCGLLYDTLYDLSIDPWPPTGQEPPPQDFCSKPALAAEPPIFMEGPNGPDTRVRILLRDNVYWSDGVRFNATDVKFTFDLILDISAFAVAYGDFEPVVESVEIVNETCVDFNLHAQYADVATLLSYDWGLAIMPYHKLGKYTDNPGRIKHDPSNWDFTNPSAWLPVTGPFKMTEIDPVDHITFEKNPNYFGYDLGWGPYNVTKIIFKWIPDPTGKWPALRSHEIDFCDPPIFIPLFWPIPRARSIPPPPDLRIWLYNSPASNPLFFNLDHPILSNRYVRQAIAHAIDYQYIIGNVLPNWSIETAYRGTTLITPLHYYTDPNNVTIHLINDYLDPYEHNITRALKYMEMWYYSRVGTDYTKGPVGDANFNGFVDLVDYYIWVDWFGKQSHQVTFLPGQDKDPDFDNNGWIDIDDFYNGWALRRNFYYPENSTTHVWSR